MLASSEVLALVSAVSIWANSVSSGAEAERFVLGFCFLAVVVGAFDATDTMEAA